MPRVVPERTPDPKPTAPRATPTDGTLPPRRPRLNLDDLLPVAEPAPAPPPKPTVPPKVPKPRKPSRQAAETEEWPDDLHQPARSWINKLPKPTAKSLPFYESGLRVAFACAWVDQKTDRSELNCLHSWALYVRLHAKAEPDIARRLREVAEEAEKAGRISNADCLRHAEIVASHGTADARQSLGSLCLAVVTADKRLEQGEIPLIAGIWKCLKLETEKLIKAFEKLIAADKALKAAAVNAGVTANMTAAKKHEVFRRRFAILNGRMQSRRGADLEHDREELAQVIRAIQIYKELTEHVR